MTLCGKTLLRSAGVSHQREPSDGGSVGCLHPTKRSWVLAPIEVLTDLLRQMGSQPEKAKSRYLLGLMLMRKKVVRPLESEQGQEQLLRLEVIATGAEINLPICVISRGESEQLLEELNELLYCEAEEMEAEEMEAEEMKRWQMRRWKMADGR